MLQWDLYPNSADKKENFLFYTQQTPLWICNLSFRRLQNTSPCFLLASKGLNALRVKDLYFTSHISITCSIFPVTSYTSATACSHCMPTLALICEVSETSPWDCKSPGERQKFLELSVKVSCSDRGNTRTTPVLKSLVVLGPDQWLPESIQGLEGSL